jgi:formate/nitrite transporter FocA (FNT family)
MSEAGEDSPHLDEKQRRQAAERAAPSALVIHEIVRDLGEEELERPVGALALSGLAAGLSIGFSFLVQAYLQGALPDTPWRKLIAGFGYSTGFLFVILGRQQLFTETTLTALIPALTRRDLATLGGTLRVWLVVLAANMAGTYGFAAVAAYAGFIDPSAVTAMDDMAAHLLGGTFWHSVMGAASAGWLIGLMVWLLPASGTARPLIVILVTYIVALCQFPHIIAGSVEAAYAVLSGHAPIGAYFTKFLAPVLIGNVFGGTVLAALLNHAPVSSELTGDE